MNLHCPLKTQREKCILCLVRVAHLDLSLLKRSRDPMRDVYSEQGRLPETTLYYQSTKLFIREIVSEK